MERFGRLSFAWLLSLCVLVVAAPGTAVAQAFPSKPVHLTVGFPPGGIADIVTRAVAAQLAVPLGQSVVVENKPGADGRIGLQQLLTAPPDGYLLTLADAGLAVNEAMFKQPGYDLKDFTPIMFVGEAANFIAVTSSLPVSNLQEFVTYAKARPGQLNYAATASSTMLGAELFKSKAGLDIVSVRYKGQAQGLPAVIANECQMMVSSVGPLLPFVKDGKLKALAVTSRNRSALAPDVPTAVEAGVPGMVYTNWYVILGPKGMPKPVVERLQADLRKALADPALIARLAPMGITVNPMGGEEFMQFLDGEVAKMKDIVKAAGIKPE